MINPLSELSFPIPFDRIRAEHVEPATRELVSLCELRLESIAALDEPRTYENTAGALDALTRELDEAMSVVRHLKEACSTPEIRLAHASIEPVVSSFHSRLVLHAGLFRALREYSETADAAALAGPRARYLSKTIADFRRHGADLPPDKKAELEKIDIELSKTTTAFSDNVLDSTNAFEYVVENEDALSGLPPTAIVMARESAQTKGVPGWRFTLQAPSYLAVTTYLDDASVRERFYRSFHSRASGPPHDNRPHLARILELRRAKAALLGYRDFADFVTADRMAASGDRAERFLEDLRAGTEPFFHRENRELQEFRDRLEGAASRPMESWDIAYYAEKLRKSLYDFDEEMLRPYFPLERVKAGMFDIAGRLFGIRVEERKGAPVWDPEVRFYEIHDSGGGLLGAFYADWFPRENKRPGAWMDAFVTGDPDAGGSRPHVGLMCGNLTPPSGGKPALLTHRDVETVFHEFGHLLHHCLGRVPVRCLSGTAVAWDFVELPSQIMENWCWERESLDLISGHHETGEPLPATLFEKLRRARTFRAGNFQMRQLAFGAIDMALHRRYDPDRDGNPVDYCRRLYSSYSPAPLQEDYATILAFSHLFASPIAYAAGYYSYKWAEVLDADAFDLFLAHGIFNLETGMRFRRTILEKGDSEDPASLYRQFAGRDPGIQPLLIRSGLVPL